MEDYGNKINKLLTLNTLPKQFDDLVKGINKISSSLDTLSSKFQNTSSAQSSASQANQSYTQSTNQLNQAIATTEIRYAEIVDNILAYDNNVTKLTADTIQNKIRIKELGDELKRLDKEYKNGNIGLTDYLNKSALLKQRQTELSEQNKQYSSLMRNHAAVIISASSSYNEMNAAVLALEKRLKSMSKDSFLGSEGQKTLQQIQTLKNELKSMDAQMGNYQRNVGNYASHWNGLGMSVQQVARELPSLAVGWNTFFLAISNNLPILADEIKKANAEFKAMRESGMKGIPVWKQLTGAIFNWQTALVIGITLLSVYGKDLVNWISGLGRAKKALDSATIAQLALNNATKEGIKNSISETNKLNILYKMANDTSRSIIERKQAVDELQAIYPEYFKNLSDEAIMTGRASDAYNMAKNNIIELSKAKVKLSEIDKLSVRAQELSMQAAGKLLELRKAEKEPDYVDPYSGEIIKAADRVGKLREEYNGITEELRNIYKAQQAIVSTIKVSDIATSEGDLEKQRELERLAKEQAKYQEDIAKRLSETRISLIDDEYEKERQTAQKKYEENIASIKGNSEEENELRKNYEQILQDELLAIDKNYLDKKMKKKEKGLKAL